MRFFFVLLVILRILINSQNNATGRKDIEEYRRSGSCKLIIHIPTGINSLLEIHQFVNIIGCSSQFLSELWNEIYNFCASNFENVVKNVWNLNQSRLNYTVNEMCKRVEFAFVYMKSNIRLDCII